MHSRKQYLVGESRALPSGSGDELGDDRADQRKTARDPQAAEEIRQRTGNAQTEQDLPAGRPAHPEQVEEPMVDAAQAERRVGDDREEGDDDRAQDERDARVVHPDDDERRDGDDRRHLQQHGVGEKAHFDPSALHEEQRHQRSDDGRDRQGGERDAECDAERFRQQRPIGDEGKSIPTSASCLIEVSHRFAGYIVFFLVGVLLIIILYFLLSIAG